MDEINRLIHSFQLTAHYLMENEESNRRLSRKRFTENNFWVFFG